MLLGDDGEEAEGLLDQPLKRVDRLWIEKGGPLSPTARRSDGSPGLTCFCILQGAPHPGSCRQGMPTTTKLRANITHTDGGTLGAQRELVLQELNATDRGDREHLWAMGPASIHPVLSDSRQGAGRVDGACWSLSAQNICRLM